MMRARRAFACAALLAARAAAASPPAGAIDAAWECWYAPDRGPAIACRPMEVAPPGEAPPALRERPAAPRHPAAGKLMLIPLYSPPFDMARAERLARAVMCGRRPACTVAFSATPPR